MLTWLVALVRRDAQEASVSAHLAAEHERLADQREPRRKDTRGRRIV